MKLNHRGQTLILFVLLLPVLLLVLGFLVDIGYLHIQKRKMDTTINDILTYGIEHIETEELEDKLVRLLQLNLNGIEKKEITIQENQITIRVTKKTEHIFPFLGNQEKMTIQKSAWKDQNQIRIIKE